MNSAHLIFPTFLVVTLILAEIDNIRLTAVTDGPVKYLHNLYFTERNGNPPAVWDPAIKDSSFRLFICSQVNNSGVFTRYGRVPVDEETVLVELEQPRYTNLARDIYEPRSAPSSSLSQTKYVNGYMIREFEVARFLSGRPERIFISFYLKEYVFTCLLRETRSNNIIPYYVSKVYNEYGHFRFLFPERGENDQFQPIMLIERSAEAYTPPYFNVELHYLRMRRNHQPENNLSVDPVCRMSMARIENSQAFRLCTVVLKSSYFADKIRYPRELNTRFCFNRQITFRTPEGQEKAAGKLYNELLVCCRATMLDGSNGFFYISRAYNTNQVFVYQHNITSNRFYLENLSIEVDIVKDYYNFGDVEI